MNLLGPNQEEAELGHFLDLVKSLGVRKYLEVGCRNGETFAKVMQVIGDGYGMAIDLPENADSKARLASVVHKARIDGAKVDAIWGNSNDPRVIAIAKSKSPFDLVLIDADHRYEGVKRDWENFHQLAPVIALHDIDAPDDHMSDGYLNGVGKFWREIKDGYRHEEFITPGSCMGFGIIYR